MCIRSPGGSWERTLSKRRMDQPHEFVPVAILKQPRGAENNKNSKAFVTQICLQVSSSRTGCEEAASEWKQASAASGKWEILDWHGDTKALVAVAA